MTSVNVEVYDAEIREYSFWTSHMCDGTCDSQALD